MTFKRIACQVLKTYSFSCIFRRKREYSVDTFFVKNDFDPKGAWHSDTTKVLVLAN